VQRNRSARLAVLGSSVQRPASAYPSRSSSALRRRIVLGILLVLSLVLITVYFRESSGGVLHDVQGAGSTVLRPFQVAGERVARPFRDAYGYFAGLAHAKSQRDKLRRENDRLRQKLIRQQLAAKENVALRREARYVSGRRFPQDYRPVVAATIAKPPSPFEQKIVLGAGTANGVRYDSPVVTSDGLVGKVSKVTRHTAQVTLLTDEDSAVSAVDLHTSANGIVRHARGSGDTLFLDRVEKSERVSIGDAIVTSGWRTGKLTSLYPRGIPIGTVTSVSRTDTELYTLVQVTPLVDFSSLDSAIVLVPNGSGPPR
jgi:rod shape-determining protein MreC